MTYEVRISCEKTGAGQKLQKRQDLLEAEKERLHKQSSGQKDHGITRLYDKMF